MGKSIRRGCGISVIFSLSGFAEKNQFCSHAFPRLHFVAKFEMLQKTRSQNKDRQGRRFLGGAFKRLNELPPLVEKKDIKSKSAMRPKIARNGSQAFNGRINTYIDISCGLNL